MRFHPNRLTGILAFWLRLKANIERKLWELNPIEANSSLVTVPNENKWVLQVYKQKKISRGGSPDCEFRPGWRPLVIQNNNLLLWVQSSVSRSERCACCTQALTCLEKVHADWPPRSHHYHVVQRRMRFQGTWESMTSLVLYNSRAEMIACRRRVIK